MVFLPVTFVATFFNMGLFPIPPGQEPCTRLSCAGMVALPCGDTSPHGRYTWGLEWLAVVERKECGRRYTTSLG